MAEKYFECWVIRLRSDEGFLAKTLPGFAFDTWKFTSYAAALAHCRQYSVHPADYVLCRARFTQPRILEVREIDYAETTLALAVSKARQPTRKAQKVTRAASSAGQ